MVVMRLKRTIRFIADMYKRRIRGIPNLYCSIADKNDDTLQQQSSVLTGGIHTFRVLMIVLKTFRLVEQILKPLVNGTRYTHRVFR